MNFCTVKETAERWGVSERFVRKLCKEGRIENVVRDEDTWLIPSSIEKPGRKKYEKKPPLDVDLSDYAKRIVRQKIKNNHYGIYEYIQLNLTYSSNRMASNRLTRNEVEEIYRTNKITSSFEPAKVDDIIETINHFEAVRYIIDNIEAELTPVFIQHLHQILTYGTYADRKENLRPGEFRLSKSKIGVQHKDIIPALSAILKEYEKGAVDMERILDFHVRFEQIHPFDDGNGRVGRLIMFKECLRHDIMPFILDDKRRSRYLQGIREWFADRYELVDVVMEAQSRFESQIELQKLQKAAEFYQPEEYKEGLKNEDE